MKRKCCDKQAVFWHREECMSEDGVLIHSGNPNYTPQRWYQYCHNCGWEKYEDEVKSCPGSVTG